MNKLLTFTACLVLIAFQAPAYAGGSDTQGDKPCTGMDDGSFKCASFLAAETFYDLLETDLPQQAAIDACLEVLTDQMGKGVGGFVVYRRGDVALTISAKNNILSCTAK